MDIAPAIVKTKPLFAPVAGNFIVRGAKRVGCGLKIESIALRAVLYHGSTLVSIAVRTPLVTRYTPGLGMHAFKQHFMLMFKALKMQLTAAFTALTTDSCEKSCLKADAVLFPYSATPNQLLRFGAEFGDVKVFKQAVALGADIKVNDSDLLRGVIYGKQYNMLPILVQQGWDINSKDKFGASPLIKAIEMNDLKAVATLLELGADLHVETNIGNVLHYAACEQNAGEIIALLLDKGADANAKNSYNQTPLKMACITGNAEAVSVLLEKGNVKPDEAVYDAFQRGHLDIVAKLVEKGADINKKFFGRTILHDAAKEGDREIVAKLIELGADIRSKDHSDMTPFAIAKEHDHTEILDMLKPKSTGLRSWLPF